MWQSTIKNIYMLYLILHALFVFFFLLSKGEAKAFERIKRCKLFGTFYTRHFTSFLHFCVLLFGRFYLFVLPFPLGLMP